MHGRKSPLTVLFNLVPGQEVPQLIIADKLNLVDFMGSTKAIHEMQERYSRVESGNLRNDRQVMGFLNTEGAQHGKSAATDEHGVAVVTVDGKGLSSQGTGSNVNDRRQKFAGDLVEVRNV